MKNTSKHFPGHFLFCRVTQADIYMTSSELKEQKKNYCEETIGASQSRPQRITKSLSYNTKEGRIHVCSLASEKNHEQVSFKKCVITSRSISYERVLFWENMGFTKNKSGTSKVGAISKAQKTQNTFFKKKTFFFFRKRRIVPKNVDGGTLWASLTYILLQNIKKLERGTLLRHFKIFEKSHSAEKN